MIQFSQNIYPRLLLVEDDPISGSFLQTSLETLPAKVDRADSVSSALAFSRIHQHQLWLIDMNLPDGNGIALLSSLRRLYPNTPALAHTAETNTPTFRMTLGLLTFWSSLYQASAYWKRCITHLHILLWKTTDLYQQYPQHSQSKTGTKPLD
ncbi:MAG TPA: response regulator [Xylella sp.]